MADKNISTEISSTIVEDEATRRRAAYQAATGALRETFRETFEEYYEAECKDRRVPYKRKLTEEDRAEKELRRILSAHPGLQKVAYDIVAGPTPGQDEADEA